ncbi:hypothetical protein BD626DRAFT_477801 [Schizophyllum amplum]|uniref:F-box domain-containing protein n=1 Tax=Schizophyllum amplum TaxID=97359 RepID=A0A550D0H7_9AGAR|nr:hypothetical protein BD626DRAFT_477801 [Auriculariopsis ampla]
MDIYDYSSLRTTRHILNYVAPVALGLSRLQAVPAELFAGVRALRLNDVSIDIMAGPCICAPVALELCNIYEDDFAALLLDARRLTHLRLEGMPDEASELVVRGAATLQALEVDEGVIVPQMPLPALRVLALRDLQNLRAWLGAAPGVRHLFVCIPSEQTQVAVTQGTGNLVIWDTDMMIETVFDADTIAKGRALEVVTMVEYFGQGSDGSERRWHDVVGSYRYGERDVEFRHMRIPMPTELDSLFPSSLIDPDILDGKWA